MVIERINKTQVKILNDRILAGAKILREADQLKASHMQRWVNTTLEKLTWFWLKPLIRRASRKGNRKFVERCLKIQGLAGLPITNGTMCTDFHILKRGLVIREYNRENS